MSEEPKRKRLRSLASTAPKRMRLQAFTAPKSKATKDLVKRNATTAPLLRLPPELRDRIWGYVLGPPKTVHIGYHGTTHTVCDAEISEHTAYELSKSEEYENSRKDGGDMRISRERHAKCYERLSCDRYSTGRVHGPPLPRIPLDISLLSVCRQVYIEVNPIIWTTTLWSLKDGPAWTLFKSRRDHNKVQRPLLRKLHLDSWLVYKSFSYSEIMRYPELDVLHVDITGLSKKDFKDRTHFRAKEVTVICDTSTCLRDWKRGVAGAEALRQRLIEIAPKPAQSETERKEVRDQMRADREEQKLFESGAKTKPKKKSNKTT